MCCSIGCLFRQLVEQKCRNAIQVENRGSQYRFEKICKKFNPTLKMHNFLKK
jgi:hypothetical protein